ncbi:MAG TPA: EAL domain-containing protein [Kofleriaceae bacterium]|nr:EAL domain-containing protein [Kofleriaceae bacterium]
MTGGRVLIADDETALARGYARWLRAAGYDVVLAEDGRAAADLAAAQGFDVIVSDIAMPRMDGLELLRNVRQRDPVMPFVLMTARPDLETAVPAVELGALRYLIKPVDNAALEKVIAHAIRLQRLGRLKQAAQSLVGQGGVEERDRALLDASLDRALEGLRLATQPIVSWGARSVYAYEALMRTSEPSLPHPGAVLSAAEKLGRLTDVGRAVRRLAGELARNLPGDALLFINLHPSDFLDESLYDAHNELGRRADRVVLEVTERAALDAIGNVRERVARLRALGYRIAVDDLGAGYAGLSSFTSLEPDVVKLDMSLVRDIEKTRTKRTLVASLAAVCRDLGMTVVAEGVETTAERDALIEAGCDLLQGYLFAKPAPAYPEVKW